MTDWTPNPNAGHPPDGDLRRFETSHDGPMWQYTRCDGIAVTYGYGKTPEEAKTNVGKIVWATEDTPHD